MLTVHLCLQMRVQSRLEIIFLYMDYYRWQRHSIISLFVNYNDNNDNDNDFFIIIIINSSYSRHVNSQEHFYFNISDTGYSDLLLDMSTQLATYLTSTNKPYNNSESVYYSE